MTADGRPPLLHLAPPPATERPDTRVSVALALLGHVEPALDNAMTNALCPDGADVARADELASDPRYIIGRLHQALTALLADDIPPADATAVLLAEALHDAIDYRQQTCARCDLDGTCCAACWPGWRKAGDYRALAMDLGVFEKAPVPAPGPPAPLRLVDAADSPAGERS